MGWVLWAGRPSEKDKTEIPQGNAGLHSTSETGQPQYIDAYCGCG
ncbi:TPA: hypothetical protein ACFP4C_000268 [Neisseria subflava]